MAAGLDSSLIARRAPAVRPGPVEIQHLPAQHAGLAARVAAVTRDTDQIRRDTQESRNAGQPPTGVQDQR
jgi:hypothetical protein